MRLYTVLYLLSTLLYSTQMTPKKTFSRNSVYMICILYAIKLFQKLQINYHAPLPHPPTYFTLCALPVEIDKDCYLSSTQVIYGIKVRSLFSYYQFTKNVYPLWDRWGGVHPGVVGTYCKYIPTYLMANLHYGQPVSHRQVTRCAI